MIILTKIDGKEFMLNENHIETATETPDTVIVLDNKNTIIVKESIKEIVSKCAEFKRSTRSRLGGGRDVTI
jgi:flagellar protein FlbD